MKAKTIIEIILWVAAIGLCFLACVQVIHAQPLPPTQPLIMPMLQPVTLAWDPSPDAGVGAYEVHYGTESGLYVSSTNAGLATSVTVQGLSPEETYCFAVRAIGTNQLASIFSNEIVYTVPSEQLAPPTEFGLSKVPVYVLDVYATDDLAVGFTNIAVARIVIVSDRPYKFFTVSNRMELMEGMELK